MSEIDSKATPSNNVPDIVARQTPVWRGIFLAALATIGLIHIALTIRLFPSPASLWSDEPVISVDHAIHLYHGYLGARFLREHGTSWGYDPFFMAGYPKTPVYDSSSGPAELFQFVAGGGYSPRAYKIGIAFLVVGVPFLLAAAAAGFGATWPALAATSAWTVWYWWVGFPDILVRTGLVAFVWSSAVAVMLPGLVLAWGSYACGRHWIAMTIAAAAGIQAHSIFPLMVLAPVLVGYSFLSVRRGDHSLTGSSTRNGRWHLATWLSVAVALSVTCFWWWPLLRFLPLKTASDLFMTHQGDPNDPVWERVAKFTAGYYLGSDGRIPLLLVLFGTIGLVRIWRSGRRAAVVMQAIQIVLLSLLTFAGSEWQVTRNLEPLRFLVPLGLSWCVPAGEGTCAVVAALQFRLLHGSGWSRLRWFSAACFLLGIAWLTVPALWWWSGSGPRLFRLPSTWQYSALRMAHARPLAVALRPEMRELVEWIRGNTDNSARILFEDQLRLLENIDPEQPESLHWTPLLPLLTGREYIGGLYHLAFIPHQHAAFGDWHLAGQHIRIWSPERLGAFCEQYNIGWVITWSRASPLKEGEDRMMPLSTDIFASMPFVEPLATLPRHTTRPDENVYTVFRVRRVPSYFARGRGRVVHSDFNRIELADLEPENGELVLRYHFLETLRAEPPAFIARADVAGDPIGFIRILSDKPISHMLLYNAYGAR